MNKKTILILILILFSGIQVHASFKVYLIHGYAGPGFEMKNIQMAVEKEGYTTEIYTYPSLVKDVEVVGKEVCISFYSPDCDDSSAKQWIACS